MVFIGDWDFNDPWRESRYAKNAMDEHELTVKRLARLAKQMVPIKLENYLPGYLRGMIDQNAVSQHTDK